MTATVFNIKYILDNYSAKEKVELFKQLYKDIADCGINGDTELAHINPVEAKLLKWFGGAGTVNEATGLVQYFGGSPPPPPPAASSVTQTSEFPTELKPFVSDVLGKAQAIQEKRETEGYIPYEGPQVAGFTPEQEQAFSGIQGLVGQGQQYFDPSTQLAASASRTPTGAEISSYMSPYVQQVVDIQKREALRQGDVAQQGLAAQAVGAGGYGGSRMAILEAEQNRNLQQQLGDIQTRGIAAAYEDAQARLAQQRQREFTGSSQFAQLGQIAPQQALKELTAVEAVGAQRQAQSQQGLNIAKQQFEEEQIFPEQTLQQYQSVIRGFPLAPNTYRQTQTTTPAPSYLQQAAGLGATGLGIAGAFGAFKAKGGLVRRMQGGPVDQNSGLGSIVVKKQVGTKVGDIDITAMSTEQLRRLRDRARMTDLERANMLDLEIKKRITGNNEATITALPTEKFNPPPSLELMSKPNITPTSATFSSTEALDASKPKAVKPTFGSLASLRETPKSDEYFAKATEILGKREKRILDKMDDPSDKYEYLAGLLSGIAGGTPGAGLGQLVSAIAPQALAGAKELRKDREALQEKAEETSLQVGKLGAEQEAKQKKLEEAVFTALTKSKLTAKDLSIIAKNKVEAIAKIQDVVDEGTLLRLASNTQIDPDIKYAARVKLGLPVADPRTGTGGTTGAGDAATTAAKVKKLTITGR